MPINGHLRKRNQASAIQKWTILLLAYFHVSIVYFITHREIMFKEILPESFDEREKRIYRIRRK